MFVIEVPLIFPSPKKASKKSSPYICKSVDHPYLKNYKITVAVYLHLKVLR